MKALEAYLFSPAHPKLPRQLVLRVGYVEDAFEARTKLAGFFSSLLHERREWRIHHRMSNHPFQPGSHQIFVQRGSVQTGLNVKARLVADDADYGGGILTIWKEFLCLKLTEGAVEATVRIDCR